MKQKILLLSIAIIFLPLFAHYASAAKNYGTNVIHYNVVEDSSGTIGFNVKDSTDVDTSQVIFLYSDTTQLDPDWSNVVFEHWASGVSTKDSTYVTFYFYQSDRATSTSELDSTFELKDSVLNTDGTAFGVHHLNKLSGLVPAKAIIITANGVDGKTHPAGINAYAVLRVRYTR